MRHIEENMQINCVTWFCLQYPEHFPLLHHSPNGGRRNAREGGRFKAMGTKAGFPDLALLLPRKGFHGLFIEMKSPKGRQSESQGEWQKNLVDNGYRYELCRTFDDFRTIINDYLK